MTERHESSCSVYNAPAYEPGPCDCKYRDLNEAKNTSATGPRNRRVSFDGKQVFGVNPKNLCGSFDEALDKAVEACMMERAGRRLNG